MILLLLAGLSRRKLGIIVAVSALVCMILGFVAWWGTTPNTAEIRLERPASVQASPELARVMKADPTSSEAPASLAPSEPLSPVEVRAKLDHLEDALDVSANEMRRTCVEPAAPISWDEAGVGFFDDPTQVRTTLEYDVVELTIGPAGLMDVVWVGNPEASSEKARACIAELLWRVSFPSLPQVSTIEHNVPGRVVTYAPQAYIDENPGVRLGAPYVPDEAPLD